MPRWLLPLGALAPVHNVDNLTIITEINGRSGQLDTGDLQRNAAELLSA
jgi:5-oxopent-3-ene-1,2,5-tricarboxylate decarboxylase/2-hydroxyhepta-2,4-diene-1,7-dioate isomerase